MPDTTLDNLGSQILAAAKAAFGAKFSAVQTYLPGEADKLATTLKMIVAGVASNQISSTEATILLNQQKVATAAVLTAAEGMTAIAVHAAIEAGLGAVKDFINTKLGFGLL